MTRKKCNEAWLHCFLERILVFWKDNYKINGQPVRERITASERWYSNCIYRIQLVCCIGTIVIVYIQSRRWMCNVDAGVKEKNI